MKQINLLNKNPLSAIVMATVLSLSLYQGEAISGEVLDKVKSEGILRAGTTGDWEPITVYDAETESYSGYDIEMFKALAKDLGVKLELVPVKWQNYAESLNSGDIQIGGSAGVNKSRLLSIGLSDSYFENVFLPVVNVKNQSVLKGWDALNKPEVTIVTSPGTIFIDVIKENAPEAKLVLADNHDIGMKMVQSGSADASVTSIIEYTNSGFRELYPDLVTAVRAKNYTNPIPYVAQLPQKDQEWINLVNSWLESKKAEGFFDDYPGVQPFQRKNRPE